MEDHLEKEVLQQEEAMCYSTVGMFGFGHPLVVLHDLWPGWNNIWLGSTAALGSPLDGLLTSLLGKPLFTRGQFSTHVQ